MNVEIGTETPIFLFWEYLFRKFGILSLQCSKEKKQAWPPSPGPWWSWLWWCRPSSTPPGSTSVSGSTTSSGSLMSLRRPGKFFPPNFRNKMSGRLGSYTGRCSLSVYKQRWNAWTAFLVEISGHKLEFSQTRVFVCFFTLIFPFNKMLFTNRLEFSCFGDFLYAKSGFL